MKIIFCLKLHAFTILGILGWVLVECTARSKVQEMFLVILSVIPISYLGPYTPQSIVPVDHSREPPLPPVPVAMLPPSWLPIPSCLPNLEFRMLRSI